MAGIGFQELMIILVVVMVIFGAGKLPDVMKSLGAGIREVKGATEELKAVEKDFNRDKF